MQLDAMLGGEGQVGQDVMLALVHQGSELGPTRPELVGDLPPGLASGVGVGLEEGLAQGGGDHGVLALRHVGQGVPHQVDAAALPGGAEDAGDRLLEAFVGIGDDQLHAFQAAPDQALEEARPERLRLRRADLSPMISRRPSVLAATAIIAATETIRPPSRTLR